jgi:DNA-binding Lrp family transcriptional regulator
MSDKKSNNIRLDHARIDAIFKALPPLGSKNYLKHLKEASARELPAQVLVRAYRQLPPGSPEASATLVRLLGDYDKTGYLAPVWNAARERISRRDWFGVEDLAASAIEEIVATLGGERGKGADTAWVSFCYQRVEDAYRAIVGRRGERQDPEKAEPREVEDGENIDPVDEIASEAVLDTDWHGKIEANDAEWLEAFVSRELAKVPDDRIREVARDLFGAAPTPMKELAERYGVERTQIHRWREIARTRIYAALQTQNEREIDISWLRPR